MFLLLLLLHKLSRLCRKMRVRVCAVKKKRKVSLVICRRVTVL